MDLRPINPYYKKNIRKSISKQRAAVAGYSYPYTWITPVTDRTQEDVERARALISKGRGNMTDAEKEEYSVGLKGCLNKGDMERIENNIQILLDVLEIDSESYVGAIPEFPTENYFVDMKNNVAAIRAGYCTHEDTPSVPELPYNTWTAYNDIEKILLDVYEVVSAQFHYFSAEIYAGEETGLLL